MAVADARGLEDGLGDGVMATAQATRLALEEARGRGETFARGELDQAVEDLKTIEKMFVDTIVRVTRSGTKVAGTQIQELGKHVERTARKVRPSIESAVAEAMKHPVKTAGEAAQTGVKAVPKAAGMLLQAMGGLLQGAGEDSDTWASLLRTYGFRTAAFYPPAVFFIDPDRFQSFKRSFLGFEYRKVEFAEGDARVAQVAGYLAGESWTVLAGWLGRASAVVVADEVYEHIVYAPHRHVYFATLPGMASRTICCSSLSKTYSITGWRLGYIIAAPEVIAGARKVHDFLTE